MAVVSRAVVEYGRVGLLDEGDRVLQVQVLHEVGAALVEVDGAVVDGGVRRAGVHGAQEASRTRLDDLYGAAAVAADVGQIGGALAAGPVPGLGAAAQQLRVLQLGEQLGGGRAEEGASRRR